MLQKVFNESKNWGWLLDEETDEKTNEVTSMSVHQTMGLASVDKSKTQMYTTSIFNSKPQMSEYVEKKYYPDNPKFLDGKIEINVPKTGMYNSGWHGTK